MYCIQSHFHFAWLSLFFSGFIQFFCCCALFRGNLLTRLLTHFFHFFSFRVYFSSSTCSHYFFVVVVTFFHFVFSSLLFSFDIMSKALLSNDLRYVWIEVAWRQTERMVGNARLLRTYHKIRRKKKKHIKLNVRSFEILFFFFSFVHHILFIFILLHAVLVIIWRSY